jgi:hypothetical protein
MLQKAGRRGRKGSSQTGRLDLSTPGNMEHRRIDSSGYPKITGFVRNL